MAKPDRSIILVCIVTRGRHDASIPCAVSMLHMQTVLMTTAEPVTAEVHFVKTLNDALNVLRQHGSAAGALVADCSMGFDPDFALRALASGLPVVAGSYPLPEVDWERVKTQPKNEDAAFWGYRYNIQPTGRIGPSGYAHVSEAQLGVAWVRKDVVDSIAARHPDLAARDGTFPFAMEGVYDGALRTADERFLDLHGGDVWADIERPATSMGPLEFGGCVGRRRTLR